MDIARPKKYKVDTVKRWRREGRGYAGAEGLWSEMRFSYPY